MKDGVADDDPRRAYDQWLSVTMVKSRRIGV
jgi:hypothetical protein